MFVSENNASARSRRFAGCGSATRSDDFASAHRTRKVARTTKGGLLLGSKFTSIAGNAAVAYMAPINLSPSRRS